VKGKKGRESRIPLDQMREQIKGHKEILTRWKELDSQGALVKNGTTPERGGFVEKRTRESSLLKKRQSNLASGQQD